MIKKFTLIILEVFDYFHKKKIIKFLKNQNYIFNIFIDVGAHKGETIILFLKNFKPKKIISFEASKMNYEYLLKNILVLRKKFPKSNLIIENSALGDREEIKEFKQMRESSSSTFANINFDSNYLKKKFFYLGVNKNEDLFKTSQIQIIKLSKYLTDNNINQVDLLKIDTEGFEYEILKGAGNRINKFKYILFEHHYDTMIKKNYTYRDINEYLTSRNFRVVFKSRMFFRKTFEYIYKNQY